jgi:hypothetical protein
MAVKNQYTGIASGARLALQRLGHQDEQLVIKHDQVPKADIDDNLRVCAIDSVFTDPRATFIVFGTPNVSLVMPSNGETTSWDRLAAFMFWRTPSAVVPTKGRVQAGVFCELRDISDDARLALRLAANDLVGTRKASCAHTIALALHRAGFRSSKGNLRLIYRPSHLAAVLWNGELTYHDKPVELRWITTDKSAHDHFIGTWMREYRSFCRLVNKLLHKGGHQRAPVFDRTANSLDMSGEWPDNGPQLRVSINRPSPLGVNLSYVVGQQPEFSIELDIDEPALAKPIKAFDRKLSRIDFIKSKVLFSPVTCWLMAKILEKDVGTTDYLPSTVVANMLTVAPTMDPMPIYKYNFVLTGQRFKVKRLLSNDGRDNKFLAWMLAKHVLLSRWSKDVRAAGELWVCKLTGQLVIFVNTESGSYRPTDEQMQALSRMLTKKFGLPVVVGVRPAS